MKGTEVVNNEPAADTHEDERANWTGRLYGYARKLLAEKPDHYLKPQDLEFELVGLAKKRLYKPPKWMTQADHDACFKAAADRAREDFRADVIPTSDGTPGAAGCCPRCGAANHQSLQQALARAGGRR